MFEYFKRLIWQNKAEKKEKPLNLYQYKFLRYKKERDRLYPLSLSRVETNHSKGLISVILPVYNGADLVGKSIESVLSQTEKNFEFIIINDGSSDNTKDIIEGYAKKDKRITVVNQENRRIPRTLSRGFSMAKGEFFTWTSADNIMPENFLERMKAELEKDEDTAMVYANMRLINEKGKTYKNHGWFEQPFGSGNVIFPSYTSELNTYPNNTIGAAFMYRAKAAAALGCYSYFKHTLEDYDYWMRMNSLFNIKHVSFKEPIYYYRWHSGSLTAKDKELGITKNRYKLMLLDDARRDFYMSPMLWYIKTDSAAAETAEEFKAELIKRGHKILSADELKNLYFGKEAHNFAVAVFGNAVIDEPLPDGTKSVHFISDSADEALDGFDITAYVGQEKSLAASNKHTYVFSDMETAASYIDIKLKNDLLYRLEELIESDKTYKKKLSFMLCTCKISPVLKECMDALANQTLDKSEYEIVLVDNSCEDFGIKELALDMQKKYPELTVNYITAPIKGLSNARNTGLWEAQGEILHYIDDDAIADKALAESAVAAFEKNKNAGVIGGNIILEVPEGANELVTPLTKPLWSELILENTKYKEARDYGEYPYGANFAVRRQTLMQIGGFRTGYGRIGGNYAGGEETLVCFMTEETGMKVGLEPSMTVTHRVDKARFTKEHIEKTAYAGLFTQYKMRRDVYAPQDWNDNLLAERKRNAASKMNRCKEDSPDFIYYKAVGNALDDIIKMRQRDYDDLQKRMVSN